MTEKLLKQIVDELGSIYANIPSGTDLFEVEDKLDRLIVLMEKQCRISEDIFEKLDNISDNIPRESSLSTSAIETRFGSMLEMINDMNGTLNNIQRNTDN